MTEKEYIIFCDESDREGKYYSNFYGGLIVGTSNYQRVTDLLNKKKQELNLYGKVKWEKVTGRYLLKYVELIECFFDEVVKTNVKVRIMFRQNVQTPKGLRAEQVEMQYFLLYYQFIKHAFGLEFIEAIDAGTRLRLYFDLFPDTREKAEVFKGFLYALQKFRKFNAARISIAREDIAEVRTEDHVLLQCLDVVLGAMAFRLNDKHKAKPKGMKKRASRTRAKETLYKTILKQIRRIHPRFNIGVTTSLGETLTAKWTDPYLHWSFLPRNAQYDPRLTKQSRKK